MLHPSSQPCIEAARVLDCGIVDAVEDIDYQVFTTRATVGRRRRLEVALPAWRQPRARDAPTAKATPEVSTHPPPTGSSTPTRPAPPAPAHDTVVTRVGTRWEATPCWARAGAPSGPSKGDAMLAPGVFPAPSPEEGALRPCGPPPKARMSPTRCDDRERHRASGREEGRVRRALESAATQPHPQHLREHDEREPEEQVLDRCERDAPVAEERRHGRGRRREPRIAAPS